MELFYILLGIIGLFFILLTIKNIIKHKSKWSFCVICVSISLTWIILLVLYFSKSFNNILIISLLMGMSITGIYYLAEKKIKNDKIKVFRLPFILTLITIIYYILTFENIINSIFILSGLWVLFFLIYSWNNSNFVKKLLECCKE